MGRWSIADDSWLMAHDLWKKNTGTRIDVGSDTLWAVGPANFPIRNQLHTGCPK